jgi:hypothetical protein
MIWIGVDTLALWKFNPCEICAGKQDKQSLLQSIAPLPNYPIKYKSRVRFFPLLPIQITNHVEIFPLFCWQTSVWFISKALIVEQYIY